MEYCKNGTMSDLIRRRGCLPEVECRYFMSQLVEAISYLQYKGIMHRDLKPANLLIDEIMNLKEKYGLEIDIWALGVLMFYFIEGTLPIIGHTESAV